jgi:signal transduction histidine kinase
VTRTASGWSHGVVARPWQRSVLLHATFATAFALAAFLGRATIIDGGTISLVWPAAGVAVLWVGWAWGRGRVAATVAVAMLAVLNGLVNHLTGAPLALLWVIVLANLIQATAAVAILGPGLTRPALGHRDGGASVPLGLETVRGSVHLVAGAAFASVGGAFVGCAGLALVLGAGAADGQTLALWWGRNVSGIVTVVALVQILVHRYATRATASQRRLASGSGWTGARSLELAVLVAMTVSAFAILFDRSSSSSFYPLLALTVWAGLRFSSLVVTVYTTGFGAAAVALTLGGVGPFAAVDSAVTRAIDVQLFVAVSVLLGLVLAASLSDQRRLLGRSLAAEAEAHARADLFAAVAEKMTDGVIVVDTAGTVVAANTAAQQLLDEVGLGTDHQAVTHRRDGTVLPEDEWPSRRAMRDGSCPATDIVVVREGHRPSVVSVSAARLDDLRPFGSGAGAVVVYRDVTTERDQRDELAGFAGMVAHDLRAPLTAARGWVELSQIGAATASADDLAQWLGHAHRATGRMADLIDDLLAHASSTGQHLDLVDVDLAGLAAEVVALHGAEHSVGVATMPTVRADAVMVRQLLTNLVGNALKYVAPGVAAHVEIDAVVSPDGDEVEVHVTDNGLGIAPEDREAVFGRFYRAHRDRDDIAGNGLGLAVCRTIVERHGGRIRVEGGPDGVGSRFAFTLPAAVVPTPHVGVPRPAKAG